MGGAGFFFLFFSVLVLGLLSTVAWVLALVDALRISDPQWAASGQNKIVWVLVIILLGLLGAILYLVMAKPALNRVTPRPS